VPRHRRHPEAGRTGRDRANGADPHREPLTSPRHRSRGRRPCPRRPSRDPRRWP
jgi:hypothetical protein